LRSFKRLLVVAAVVASVTGLAVASALASPPMKLSLQASTGNSASWVGHGHNVYASLTIGSASAPDGYALIAVSRFGSTLPSTEPSFATSGYAAGTPRIVVSMSDGNNLFVHPDGSAEWTGNGPGNYSDFLAAEGSAAVNAVYIVADTSQGVAYTANVTAFQYNGVNLIG
jgi:hypothetical protein